MEGELENVRDSRSSLEAFWEIPGISEQSGPRETSPLELSSRGLWKLVLKSGFPSVCVCSIHVCKPSVFTCE